MPNPTHSLFKRRKVATGKSIKRVKRTINSHWWGELVMEFKALPKDEYLELNPADYIDMNQYQLGRLVSNAIRHQKRWNDWKEVATVAETKDGLILVKHSDRATVREHKH